MAELNIFHFHPGKSLLHNFNSKLKLLFIIHFSFSCIYTNKHGLLILTLLILCGVILSKLPIKSYLRELKLLLFFIPIMIIFPAFRACDNETDFFGELNFCYEGLFYGLIYVWKFVLFLILSVLIIGTTTISSLAAAVEWLLKPIPFFPEIHIATMINLTISLVPLIFDQYHEISIAQKARNAGLIKNPVKRIRMTIYPLFFKSIVRIEEIALSMESRCFNFNRPKRKMRISKADWIIFALLITINTIAIIIN